MTAYFPTGSSLVRSSKHNGVYSLSFYNTVSLSHITLLTATAAAKAHPGSERRQAHSRFHAGLTLPENSPVNTDCEAHQAYAVSTAC